MRRREAVAALRDVQGNGLLPDPVRRYSAPLFTGFVRYLRWYAGRHFHSVRVSLEGVPWTATGRPLVIYSNHPSWWDPLVFMLLGDALFPGRRGYGPMDAKSLARYPVLERLGIFAIDPTSARGGVAFMVQAQRILAGRTAILWLTAQGAFTDARQRPIALRPGLGQLALRVPGVVVVPLAVEYPFWNESRPEALCRFGSPLVIDELDAKQRSAQTLNAVFERALSRTMDQLSHESQQRDPALFRALLRGRSGVGGIYDVWRRLRAWSRGRSFEASHGPPP